MGTRAPGLPPAALVVMFMLSVTTVSAAGGQRAFEHVRHERVACRECHGAADQHRVLLVRTSRDCSACHHDRSRGLECRACHRATEMPAPRVLTAAVSGAVKDLRSLPFSHAVHDAVACRDCHEGAVTLAMQRQCSTCHAPHHRDEANCLSCHEAKVRTAHRAEAHLGCAGAGCHAPATVPAPASSRNLCLLCHPDQRSHEPGGSCASCHRIPAPTSSAVARVRS